MCLILICNSERPSVDYLKKASDVNPHGMGIAWFEKKAVRFKKGITKVFDLFEISQKVKLPYTIHFRMDSVGDKSLTLTHPFPLFTEDLLALEGEAKAVLFQNGHWSGYLDIADIITFVGKKHINTNSDTAVLANLINLYGWQILNHLDISSQKICIMEDGVIQITKNFVKDGNFTCSNLNHKHQLYTYYDWYKWRTK